MRYKFRGKRLDGQGWVYGFCQPHKNGKVVFIGDYSGMTDIPKLHKVIPESVGQWTGLVDRHGKEIFEGDVLRCSDGEILGVEFDKRTAQFTAKTRWLWTIVDVCEVIGNIHDNPELMEVE